MKYVGKNGLRIGDKEVWHEGNFNPADKANKNHRHETKGTFTVAAAGWYRVAKITSLAGRGDAIFTVYTAGGRYNPQTLIIRYHGDWASGATLIVDAMTGISYWSGVRVTKDDEGSWVEVNFKRDIASSAYIQTVPALGYAIAHSICSGELGGGSGTVLTAINELAVGTNVSKGIRAHNYTNLEGQGVSFSGHAHTKTDISDLYTAVPSNADLNDYTALGFYGTASSSVGQTVTNRPTGTSAFTLLVAKRGTKGSGSLTTQILVDYPTAKPSMWIRSYSSSWGAWQRVPFASELDDKADKTQVLTNVPANAKFTDTVTTINGKTGTITKADITALGIPGQDTVYTHPANHPASMITESATRRFVSDTEKTNWNSKEPAFTKNTAFNKNFGTAAGTVCQGNDSRLSDARTPTAHTHTKAQITDMPTKLSQLENDIGAGAGLLIAVGAIEPSGLSVGDWWYKEV